MTPPAIRLVTEVPGPRSREIAARREAATPRGAAKLTGVAVERALHAVVEDVDGNRLLDLAGGIGVLAVGHCPQGVVEALARQSEKLVHMCAIVASYEPYVEVAERLNEITPGTFDKKTLLSAPARRRWRRRSGWRAHTPVARASLSSRARTTAARISRWP